MSKSILLSIKPKWVAKILNGEKTIEIRKTIPKCDLPIDVYIYCTKERVQEDFLTKSQKFGYILCPENALFNRDKTYDCNGKVVAKFTVKKVEEIIEGYTQGETMYDWTEHLRTKEINGFELLKKSCLTEDELNDYLDYYTKKTHYGYAYHIEDLVIFDKPKELSEFYKWCEPFEINKGCRKARWEKSLTKAPQNYCFVESEE